MAPDVVNKPQDWSAWLLDNGGLPVAAKAPPVLAAPQNQSLQAQVMNILESTAHHMSKGSTKDGFFPHKYIKRGDEKKLATLNSITLPEYIWGVFAMIKDADVPSNIKPALLQHVDAIVEDCRDYEWPVVRRWSEEVFSLVAENRLPCGWHSTNKIELLRISMSKVAAARLGQHRESVSKQRSGPHNDNWRGGPPCHAFNSRDGCNQPSGHVVNGRRMQHVCAFCFFSNGSTFHHPEANCRNKTRGQVSHFQ